MTHQLITSTPPQTVTVGFERTLVELISPSESTATRILRETATRHGMSVDAMKGHSREPRFAKARYEVMIALRDEGFSLTRIGRNLGGRHHTTILAGLRKMGRA